MNREIGDSLGTLHKPSASAVLDRLESNAGGIARRMASAARSEVAEYAAVRDPVFASEVLEHAIEHVQAFVRAGRRGQPPAGAELEFVRERGAQRARELMPLDALLEVYLIGQRVVWEAIVAAAGDSTAGMRTARELTALTFEYTHAISVAVAEAYVRESKQLASEAERGRRDLLDHLLAGRAPGAEEERRAEALGLRPNGDYAVVVAVPLGDERDSGAAAIVRALIRQGPQDAFVVARHGEVVAVMPVYVRRGPRELRAGLERTAELLRRNHGLELLAGLSPVCSGLSQLARGYSEARRALRHACAAEKVVALEDVPLLDYLASTADETAQLLLPSHMADLMQADRRSGGALSATLWAYADCDLNVARAAKRLAVHPNTVHYRLRRVQELSRRDPRRFGELAELVTALRLVASRADEAERLPA